MNEKVNRRTLGITVLGDYIVSEGPNVVLANLKRIGATAVACNPTVTAPANAGQGSWQPPTDAGHSVRTFDRPLFGKTALWLQSGPSFQPNAAYYANSRYAPRTANDLTKKHGHLIGQFIEAAADAGLEVYLQIGAAQPTGLRDEDRPRLPDGSIPQGRMADTGCLASEAILAYNRAYAHDLAAAYPAITGFRLDWPEYPCYTPQEIAQGFGPHMNRWAESQGIPLTAIEEAATAIHWWQAWLAEQLIDASQRESNNASQPFDRTFEANPLHSKQSVPVFPLAHDISAGTARERLRNTSYYLTSIIQWFQIKSALSVDFIKDWRAIIDNCPGGPRKLSLHAFMPPWNWITGFDFEAAAEFADSVSPKLYTMHWMLMVNLWGKHLVEKNPNIDERWVARALAQFFGMGSTESVTTLSDFAYPAPGDPHRVSSGSQLSKINQVVEKTAGRSPVYPLVHGYGPRDDFALRFKIATDSRADGVWVNRYGYLSDEKLKLIEQTRRADARSPC